MLNDRTLEQYDWMIRVRLDVVDQDIEMWRNIAKDLLEHIQDLNRTNSELAKAVINP